VGSLYAGSLAQISSTASHKYTLDNKAEMQIYKHVQYNAPNNLLIVSSTNMHKQLQHSCEL